MYVNLTDARGGYHLRADLVRLEDLAVIGQYWLDITLAERTSTAEAFFDADGSSFSRAGRYEFRLYANDRFLGAKSFTVIQTEGTAAPWEERDG